MFAAEEVEAIVVGLALLGRTGDAGLLAAAKRVGRKIAEVLPGDQAREFESSPLHASNWSAVPGSRVDTALASAPAGP